MLKFKRIISIIALVLLANNGYADESFRTSLKTVIGKGCTNAAKQDTRLKELNTDEYCDCAAKGMVDDLTDAQLKEAFLGTNKDIMKNRMVDITSKCMAQNTGMVIFLRESIYKGCIEKASTQKDLEIVDVPAYCSCSADKISTNLSQDDVRDLITIGQDNSKLAETKLSDKMMSVAGECMSKTLKQ